MKIKSKGHESDFPKEGAYDFISENGRGYCFPKDDILFVPIIVSKESGKGYGTKLIIELEELVKKTPELKEIAVPSIMNPILLLIVKKRNYNYRQEYSEDFGEMVDIFYKTQKEMENENSK